MNFGGLLTDVLARMRYPSAPSAATIARLKAHLNETHHELLTMPGLDRIREDVMAVSLTANQARVGLPPAVGRIRAITDRLNARKLEQVPLTTLRIQDPGQVATAGFPYQYAVVGERQVQQQPAAATGIWAVSSVAGDTTQKLYLEGLTTGGYHHVPAVGGTSLNGTTRVALGSRTDLIQIDKCYLDSAATGYVSLFDAVTSGNELARIEPGVLYSRYLTVEWYPVPTGTVTEYIDYTRAIFDMTNSTDEPLLPPDFVYLLELGARVKEYEVTSDSRGSQARVDYELGKKALRSWVLDDGDRIATLRPMATQWSSFGANFPANS